MILLSLVVLTMFRSVVIFVALLGVVWGETTQVSQCTSHNGPLPINTHIAGCTAQPCSLPQLQNADINIIFEAPRTIHRMKTLATAYMTLFGIPVPINYDLEENSITCNFLVNSYCPILRGEVLQYNLLMYIEEMFPVGVSPTIEFRIVDEDNNEIIICIRVTVTITSPNTRAGAGNYTLSIADAN